MKKYSLLLLSSLFLSFCSYGQQDLQLEVDRLTQQVQAQQKKIASYERTLNLLESKPKFDYQGIEFSVNKVVGNLGEHTVTVHGLLVNRNDSNRTIQADFGEFIDNEGNHHTDKYNVKLGGFIRLEDALPNVPVKFSVQFQVEDTNVAKIRAFVLHMLKVDQMPKTSLVFENLDIQWEEG